MLDRSIFLLSCNQGYQGKMEVVTPAAAVGYRFTLLLDFEGNVWGCGDNSNGQQGRGDHISWCAPKKIPHPLNQPIQAIAAGFHHSLFLTSSGEVWGCGGNQTGQLGIEFHQNDSILTRIPLSFSTKAISCGNDYSHFVSDGGEVWGCGSNASGQLGVDRRGIQPVPIKLKLNGIAKVCGARCLTLFLDASGTVWKAGTFSADFLSDQKLQKITTSKPIKSIAVGQYHTLLLQKDGTVLSCGSNIKGQLGFDSEIRRIDSHPGRLLSDLPPITEIFAGDYQSFFIDENLDVWGCGRNMFGQLGLGSTTNQPVSLTKIPFSPSSVASFASGDGHTIVIDNGRAWGTGLNDHHQLTSSDAKISQFILLDEVLLAPGATSVKSARATN